jgi:apolipoprotein D and lipocalin family protein
MNHSRLLIYINSKTTFLLVLTMLISGCATHGKLPTVTQVDLNAFMGKWYVIANIPTFIETDAHNATETYSLNQDGSINTRFEFLAGSFDGKRKEYNPVGFVKNTTTNAEWSMRFIWPFKADYRVVYLNNNYTTTIIGRNKRDYVWLMARTPEISNDLYEEMKDLIGKMGYETALLQKVPQQW